ncbi:unnamed protein product [Urochloa humidicola]
MGRAEDRRSTSTNLNKEKERAEEVSSPLKRKEMDDGDGRRKGDGVGRELFAVAAAGARPPPRKRKTKPTTAKSGASPDFIFPTVDTSGLVPSGLVQSRVTQLDGGKDMGEETQKELLKKQKLHVPAGTSGSAAAAAGSPRRAQ